MSKQRHLIHLICCLLPKTHRDTMEVLFSFLNWTASFSQVDEESGSKMDTHNLATVIAPSILAPPGKTSGRDEIDIVAILIEYCESMCEVCIFSFSGLPLQAYTARFRLTFKVFLPTPRFSTRRQRSQRRKFSRNTAALAGCNRHMDWTTPTAATELPRAL